MRFEVTGASRHDGGDVTRVYEAADEDEATRLANADGIVVDGVEVLIDFGPQPTMPAVPVAPTAHAAPRAQARPLLDPITPSPIRSPPQATAQVARPAPPTPPREASPATVATPTPVPTPTAAPTPAVADVSRPAPMFASAQTSVPAPTPTAAAPQAIDYRTPRPDAGPEVPRYVGLRVASAVLWWYAMLCYVAAALAIVAAGAALVTMIEIYQAGVTLVGTIVPIITSLLPAFGLLFAGAVSHGLSAACVALRDLARNSWRSPAV